MLARLDHRPMLTAALALTTIVLIAIVITLTALLVTAAPPTVTSSSGSGVNPGAAVGAGGEHYGEGWNNYGYDMDRPQPAQAGNGANSAVERHAEMIAAYRERADADAVSANRVGGSGIASDPYVDRHAQLEAADHDNK